MEVHMQYLKAFFSKSSLKAENRFSPARFDEFAFDRQTLRYPTNSKKKRKMSSIFILRTDSSLILRLSYALKEIVESTQNSFHLWNNVNWRKNIVFIVLPLKITDFT